MTSQTNNLSTHGVAASTSKDKQGQDTQDCAAEPKDSAEVA